MKNNKGITLVALVITIVVLIILAGVAISLSLGENGIFTKAKLAKENYVLAANQEALMLENLEAQIGKETSGISNGESNNGDSNNGGNADGSGEYFYHSLNGFTNTVGTGEINSLFGLMPITYETIPGVTVYEYCTYEKELATPFDLSGEFEISFKNTFFTTATAQMGGFYINFQKLNNENAYENIIEVSLGDGWSGNSNISTGVNYNGTTIYSNTLSSGNLIWSTMGTIGDGENISFYLNNTLLGTAEQQELNFDKILIHFTKYTGYSLANRNCLERLYYGDIKYYRDII